MGTAALALGCNQIIGLEEGRPASQGDAQPGNDVVIGDARTDTTTVPPAEGGVGSDASVDATRDAAPDVSPDANRDATPDISLDAAPDASFDASWDATPETGPDSMPDAPREGGGDSGATTDTASDLGSDSIVGDLIVTSVTPADTATGGRTDAVILTFNQAVDAASVTATSVQVRVSGQPVIGSLSTTGSMVTFTPDRPLALLTSHTVFVATTVAALGGVPLKTAFNSSFTTRDGAWMAAALKVETDDSADASGPALGIDSAGNAMTVYYLNGSLFAQRWVAATRQWTNPVNLGIAHGYPVLAVSENGNAVVIWHRDDGTRTNIWAAYFVADPLGGQWKGATTIETSDINAQTTGVAIDPAGNAFATWIETPGPPTPYLPYWNRYDVTSGAWLATGAAFEVPDAGSVQVQVSMDGLGNAYGAFSQANAILWTRFAGSGFATPAQIVPAPTAGFQLAVDRGGSAFLLWSTAASAYVQLFAPDAGWKPPAQIDDAGLSTYVAMRCSDGRASALWSRNVATEYSIYGSQCDTTRAGGCSRPALVENDQRSNQQPAVGLDPNGNAIALWSANGTGQKQNIWANRHVASIGLWGTPTLIESDDSYNPSGVPAVAAESPQLAVARDGRAIAIWIQRQPMDDAGNPRFDVWYNRFE